MPEAEDAIEARARVLDTAARHAWDAGEFTRSRQLFETVRDLWRGQPNSVFPLLHITQAMRFEPGYDPAAARPLLEEALTLAAQTGDPGAAAPVQLNLALVAQEQGD